jgi:hypothetical protein
MNLVTNSTLTVPVLQGSVTALRCRVLVAAFVLAWLRADVNAAVTAAVQYARSNMQQPVAQELAVTHMHCAQQWMHASIVLGECSWTAKLSDQMVHQWLHCLHVGMTAAAVRTAVTASLIKYTSTYTRYDYEQPHHNNLYQLSTAAACCIKSTLSALNCHGAALHDTPYIAHCTYFSVSRSRIKNYQHIFALYIDYNA